MKFLGDVALPYTLSFIAALVEAVAPLIVLLTGIVILLGCVGMKVSTNLGTTIVSGVFRGIGAVCRGLCRAAWRIILVLSGFIPKLFRKSRTFFMGITHKSVVSNLLAFLVALLFLVAVI